MTQEDYFQAALDANPDDVTIRLVFADWLDEQGDPRGPGYRALGIRGRVPVKSGNEFGWAHPAFSCDSGWQGWTGQEKIEVDAARLPDDWFDRISSVTANCGTNWRCRQMRRQIEDAAALAFAKLPLARQAELLGQVEAAT